ncbi:hypothetical protein F8M41_025578 [Gigaspora margarita]|uniref:DUF4238 domain-containing protein n=1 Tax=Gigaspora margarita TaxID=4874 RepID=A0A8H4ET86_GIGMA|nr:hypothetical protein F8M41_025578 [Gigaspora margarita]
MEKDQYHHYIPRFILRNFAINNHERIFMSNGTFSKKQKQRFKEKNKKDAFLQVYYKNSNQFDTSLVSKTYGNMNMYKDFNHENVMRVEDKLSKLEMQAADVIHNIVNASQKGNQVVLSSTSLDNLRKFLFIMCYRKPHRWSQFINEDFDIYTLAPLKKFMQDYNLQHPREVWLQNIREILDTTHKDFNNNLRIFGSDRRDYLDFMMDRFLVIWQAGENDEFITTIKVNSATVHLVNTIILNETKPDEVVSFLSYSNLYKSIVKYHNSKDLDIIKQDHTSLKKKLFIVLNRTHKETLSLRKNLSANYSSNWKECKILQNFNPEGRDQLQNNLTEIPQNSVPDTEVRDNLTEIVQNSDTDSEVRDQLRDNLTEIDKLCDNFPNIFQNSDSEERDQLWDNLDYQDLNLLKLLKDEIHKSRMVSPNPVISRWAIQEDVMRKKGLELNRKVNNKVWPNPYEQCLYKGPFDKAKIPAINCRCNSCIIYRKFNAKLNENWMLEYLIEERQRSYKVPKTLEPNKNFLIEMYYLKELESGYEPSCMPLCIQEPNIRALAFFWPKDTSSNFSMGNCASIFNLLHRDWMITEHFVKAKDLFVRYPLPESEKIRISYKLLYKKYLHVYAIGFHESFGDPAKYEITTTLSDFKRRFQNSDLILS